AGYKLHMISVGRLKVGWGERIATLLRLPFAMLKAFWLVVRLRPQVVIGVGGYASGLLFWRPHYCAFALIFGSRTHFRDLRIEFSLDSWTGASLSLMRRQKYS